MGGNERYRSEIFKVRLILGWYEQDTQSLEEMNIVECRRSHVEKDAVEHWHRDVSEIGRHENWDSDEQGNEKVRQTLLPDESHSKSQLPAVSIHSINLIDWSNKFLFLIKRMNCGSYGTILTFWIIFLSFTTIKIWIKN